MRAFFAKIVIVIGAVISMIMAGALLIVLYIVKFFRKLLIRRA